jgi:uncharacterized protein
VPQHEGLAESLASSATLGQVSDSLLYVLVGLVAGVLVGLTGVGGGSITTPILMLVFGQSPTTAVGTDLVFSALTKGVATAAFGYARRVDWVIVGRLALGSLPGAVVAIVWLYVARTPARIEPLVSRGIAVMLAVTALGLLIQHPLTRLSVRFATASLGGDQRYKPLLTGIAGLVIGVAVTLTSVGAGALGTVALLWLYPLRLRGHRLVATDIAHALPLTLLASLGHAALGHVNLTVLACLLTGSIPGILLASRTTVRLPAEITHALIAVMLVMAAGRLWAAV